MWLVKKYYSSKMTPIEKARAIVDTTQATDELKQMWDNIPQERLDELIDPEETRAALTALTNKYTEKLVATTANSLVTHLSNEALDMAYNFYTSPLSKEYNDVRRLANPSLVPIMKEFVMELLVVVAAGLGEKY